MIDADVAQRAFEFPAFGHYRNVLIQMIHEVLHEFRSYIRHVGGWHRRKAWLRFFHGSWLHHRHGHGHGHGHRLGTTTMIRIRVAAHGLGSIVGRTDIACHRWKSLLLKWDYDMDSICPVPQLCVDESLAQHKKSGAACPRYAVYSILINPRSN